jgi:hypothetical protein
MPTSGNGGELDSAVLLDFLVGLLGREEGGEQQPQHEGGDRDQRNCRKNFAEMEGHVSCRPLRGEDSNQVAASYQSRLSLPDGTKTVRRDSSRGDSQLSRNILVICRYPS